MPPQSGNLIMEMLHKSQLPKIFLLVFFPTLLVLTPFVSPSMRSSYLYFLLNLLIIVLGIEAGFLSSMSKDSKHHDDQKLVSAEPMLTTNTSETSTDHVSMHLESTVQPMILDKPVTVESVSSAEKGKALKRCKSRPSLFFIASCEPECEEVVEKEEKVVGRRVVEEVGELSKQELFIKAEVFIGNFYKQLKMQRENSWQRLHDLYQKTF